MQNNHLSLRNVRLVNNKVKIASSVKRFLAGFFTFAIIASLVTLYVFLIGIVQ